VLLLGIRNCIESWTLLPEVHIAEEARDNGCTVIFEEIIGSPVMYSVMNDYSRQIENPRVAKVNGDTAVQSSLEIKQKYARPTGVKGGWREHGYREGYFNITEDWNIGEEDSEPPDPEDITPLLYNPLPANLPTV
jgi:hypothetical protein